MKKKSLWYLAAAFLPILAGVGLSLAFLVSASRPVINTFTVGDVQIELTEHTGQEYLLLPGTDQPKDPTVTVKAGSEESYLFVKVEKKGDFDAFLSFEMAEGWMTLAAHPDVHYRVVPTPYEDVSFSVLRSDQVTVRETVTEQMLEALTEYPTLEVTAYAVQCEGIESPHDAWQILQS